MDLSVALENIIRLVNDVTFIPVAVGLVLVLTQIAKTAFKLQDNAAALASLIIQVVVWVVYSILKSRGMDVQFEQWSKAAETILTTLLTVMFPAVLSGLATKSVYARAAAKQVPGFRKAVKPV